MPFVKVIGTRLIRVRPWRYPDLLEEEVDHRRNLTFSSLFSQDPLYWILLLDPTERNLKTLFNLHLRKKEF